MTDERRVRSGKQKREGIILSIGEVEPVSARLDKKDRCHKRYSSMNSDVKSCDRWQVEAREEGPYAICMIVIESIARSSIHQVWCM